MFRKFLKMRFKRRYFCVEILFQDDLNALNKLQWHKLKHTNLTETIHESIENFYGDLGMATMMPSFSVIYFNSITNLALLRTSRDLQKKFANLLAFTRKIGQFNVTFKVVHVSGSIKKCKKFLVNFCQNRLDCLNEKVLNNPEHKNEMEVVEKLIEVCEVDDNMFNIK
jgi:ribonuclease P/MRP protein subunit POP5